PQSDARKIVFIPYLPCGCPGLACSSLVRLQIVNVLDDLIDLRIAEHRTKSRHRARLSVLDAVTEKVVVALCIHELRPFPGGAAAMGVTPSTRGCEQLADIDWRVILRGGSRLRPSQRGTRQRGGQHYQDAIVQLHRYVLLTWSNLLPSVAISPSPILAAAA